MHIICIISCILSLIFYLTGRGGGGLNFFIFLGCFRVFCSLSVLKKQLLILVKMKFFPPRYQYFTNFRYPVGYFACIYGRI